MFLELVHQALALIVKAAADQSHDAWVAAPRESRDLALKLLFPVERNARAHYLNGYMLRAAKGSVVHGSKRARAQQPILAKVIGGG